MVKVAPSILSADFGILAREVGKVDRAGADLIHIDVMDGHFVPNITIGPLVVAAVRKATKLPLDVHLMIENPQDYIKPFARAGADYLTVHVETCPSPGKVIRQIRREGVRPGIVLNPSTPLRKAEKFLPYVDMVLLMTVNPGFAGQKFIASVLPKIARLRKIVDEKRLDLEIEVDGGINLKTARAAIEAGVDILVAGSAVYSAPDYAKVIRELKKAG
jgi:ribulose-phosphate 3-epimerase